MKKFFRLTALAVCLALMLVMAAGCSGGGGSGEKIITIGVFEPTSGDNGAGGKQEVLGVKYANTVAPTVVIGGETYTVRLVYADNQTSTDKAPSAAQQLISDGASVVIGSYGSGVSIAAGDIFESNKVPAIGASCTNPQVTEGNDYYFRVCFLDPFQGTVMANFAMDECGAAKAYVLTQLGDDYSVGLGNYFKQAFEAMGGEVVEATFPEGTSDYTSYLTNLKNAGCDVLFAPTSTTAASYIIKQAASEGINCPVLAGDTWENSVIIESVGTSGVEVYLSTFFDENDTSTTTASNFVNGFKTFLNNDSQNLTDNGGNDIVAAVSALGYDAYMVALEAIKAAGSTSGEAIQAALKAVSYTGVTGSVRFDANGDAEKDMAYIKGVDGANSAFTFIKTQTVSDIS